MACNFPLPPSTVRKAKPFCEKNPNSSHFPRFPRPPYGPASLELPLPPLEGIDGILRGETKTQSTKIQNPTPHTSPTTKKNSYELAATN